jgi:putative monooxygenase
VSPTRVITLDDVDPIALPQGSWSRVLVSEHTVTGNRSTMGYSVFKPGMTTDDLSHAVEELAFVVSGRGAIRLQHAEMPVQAGQAMFIPAEVWHTVVNDSAEDLVMVFSFPSPDYPRTEHREPRR